MDEQQQPISEDVLAFLREDLVQSDAEDHAYGYKLGTSFATAQVHGRARQLERIALLDLDDANDAVDAAVMVAIALIGDDDAEIDDMHIAMEDALGEHFPTLAKLEGFVLSVSEVYDQI